MRGKPIPPKTKTSLWKSSNVRLASSLSLIMLFHRLLFRFLTRLRTSLLASNAESFRKRNPRISKTLTSRLAPVVGASCAGFWLGLIPAAQLRVTVAIYVTSRALEFSYNGLEEKGWFRDRPWWFGSWMLMPLSCGQLLHAFVYDRDCFPASYGNFILGKSPEYIQKKPPGYEGKTPWPGTYEIVDSLAEISKLRWPYVTHTVTEGNPRQRELMSGQSLHLPHPLPHQTHPSHLLNPYLPHYRPGTPLHQESLLRAPPPL